MQQMVEVGHELGWMYDVFHAISTQPTNQPTKKIRLLSTQCRIDSAGADLTLHGLGSDGE